jgi:hypothetical protein
VTEDQFVGLDASRIVDPARKMVAMVDGEIGLVSQLRQLENPDSRIVVGEMSCLPLLREIADCTQGTTTGDNPKYLLLFWELAKRTDDWEFFQGAVESPSMFSGREQVLMWQRGKGELAESSDARVQGQASFQKSGVIVSQMGELPVTRYSGEFFSMNGAALVPRDPKDLVAIWAFCSSTDFREEVRKIDQALKVTNASLVKIPFDLAHWEKVAAEKYPNGLPKPFSIDPTQWLFNGHPAGADEPLQVAVARLLGYQWPRQTGSSFSDCPALGMDGLEKLADNDGIVCLAPLNREQPAAQRLRALLTAARGKFDERDLIRKSGPKGSTKTTLEEWLRDDFFAQHCAIFSNRPFIWHIWDGLKDGFHALLHYHRLDHAMLKTLAYTYLGDWIRDQKAAAEADSPGAAERLGAAKKLQAKLIAILEGEAPLDIFVRWKPLHQQATGWHPDLNDGVRLNIRPFLLAGDVGTKGAGILRAKPGIDAAPKPDRGTEPKRDKTEFPWFWCGDDPGTDPVGGREFVGRRWNTTHLTLACKQAARKEKR